MDERYVQRGKEHGFCCGRYQHQMAHEHCIQALPSEIILGSFLLAGVSGALFHLLAKGAGMLPVKGLLHSLDHRTFTREVDEHPRPGDALQQSPLEAQCQTQQQHEATLREAQAGAWRCGLSGKHLGGDYGSGSIRVKTSAGLLSQRSPLRQIAAVPERRVCLRHFATFSAARCPR